MARQKDTLRHARRNMLNYSKIIRFFLVGMLFAKYLWAATEMKTACSGGEDIFGSIVFSIYIWRLGTFFIDSPMELF
jgi:hypothetical protein